MAQVHYSALWSDLGAFLLFHILGFLGLSWQPRAWGRNRQLCSSEIILNTNLQLRAEICQTCRKLLWLSPLAVVPPTVVSASSWNLDFSACKSTEAQQVSSNATNERINVQMSCRNADLCRLECRWRDPDAAEADTLFRCKSKFPAVSPPTVCLSVCLLPSSSWPTQVRRKHQDQEF